jgi:hypothetical protein
VQNYLKSDVLKEVDTHLHSYEIQKGYPSSNNQSRLLLEYVIVM